MRNDSQLYTRNPKPVTLLSPHKYSFPPETLPFNFGNTDRYMHELVFPTVKAAVTWGSILLGSGPFIWTAGILESGFWEEAQIISL